MFTKNYCNKTLHVNALKRFLSHAILFMKETLIFISAENNYVLWHMTNFMDNITIKLELTNEQIRNGGRCNLPDNSNNGLIVMHAYKHKNRNIN